jgi:RNA polymerase sigma-70 factor (ECF subfamily)
MSTRAEELLELMQRGDVRALDVLAREYGKRLLSVARRQCHLAADAEDAVQQALLAASSSMRSFRGEATPLAWLSTLVVRNCYRMNARAERHEPEAEVPCTCADSAESRQLSDRLGDALMKLSRTDRLAFLLSVEGFTSVEIAERFALTSDAVRGRLKRARKILREELGDTLVDDDGTPRVNNSPGAAHDRSTDV